MAKYNYIPADEFIIFNDNDPDLAPIKYKLPKAPAFEDTIGYGLPPKEQKWKRFEMPQKLKELQDDTDFVPSQKREILREKQSYYKDEIEFIRKDNHYIRNGLWIFIKGKQYYITGDFYFFLQHWRIEGQFVQFRIRDWESYLFDYMVDNDSYCYGTNYPKGRREGTTNRRKCKQYRIAITVAYSWCGMQSKDKTHAEEIHKTMLLPVWRDHMPFWLKPIYNGKNNDESELNFSSPLAKNNPDYGKRAMNSKIDYRDSGETAYDGLKLLDIFNDEVGKTIEADIYERYLVQRLTLTNHQHLMPDGSRRRGKVFNGSTVAEMDKGGGKVFKKLCNESHFQKRNEQSGRTASWLYNFFIPSCEGFGDDMPLHLQKKYKVKAWIDDYGFDNLDPETGRPLAEAFLLALREEYKRNGNTEAEIEQTRLYPLRWKDCWKTSVKDCNFNLAILEERIEQLEADNSGVQRGFFEWENNIRDTRVLWVPDPNGRFEISYQFADPRDSNKFFTDEGFKIPANTRKFCAGGDPYKFSTKKNSTNSFGAGAVFMKHDINLDPPTKDIREYVSNRFVCVYQARPTDKKVYGEDMIMMCVYFGCKMYPEVNVTMLWDYFEDRGYGRFLYIPYDEHKQRYSDNPGASTNPKIQQKIYSEYQYYIQHFGMNEQHLMILEQCKEIEGDMQPFDLFVAGGYALMSADNYKFLPEEQAPEDYQELFQSFLYPN